MAAGGESFPINTGWTGVCGGANHRQSQPADVCGGISPGTGVRMGAAMPFQFKKSEPLAKAVRRVFAERIGVACDDLEKADRPEVIHRVRKEIKKLRAVLSLVRSELARDEHRAIRKPLRRAAARLAAVRDARVKFRALSKLAKNSEKKFPVIHKLLRKDWRREMRRLQREQASSDVDRWLQKAGRRLRRTDLKSLTEQALASGLSRSYGQGQKWHQRSGREPLPECFHAWRKHVKTLWYQLCLLPLPHLKALHRLTRELELLGERLGEEHDLHLLEAFIAENAVQSSGESLVLRRLAALRREELQNAALKLGARLYAAEPKVFVQRLKLNRD